MFDLFCIGGSSIDLVLKTPHLPRQDEKLVVGYRGNFAGGLVANTACAAARLGLTVGWTGQVGNDVFGKTFLDGFSDYGVDFSSVIIQENATSDFCVVLVEPGGERTILVVPTLGNPPPISQSSLDAIQQSKIVYLIPQDIQWFKNLSLVISKGEGKIALDIEANSQVNKETLEEILSLTHIVFCNTSGLQSISGIKEIRAGARRLLGIGVEIVVVTQGRLGACAMTRDEFAKTPPFTVPVVDTTGAGDCFHAAFMKGLLSNWDLQYSLDFANAAAAISIQHEGARGGLPTCQQVKSFLNQKPIPS